VDRRRLALADRHVKALGHIIAAQHFEGAKALRRVPLLCGGLVESRLDQLEGARLADPDETLGFHLIGNGLIAKSPDLQFERALDLARLFDLLRLGLSGLPAGAGRADPTRLFRHASAP
jgi:hypothetical protein